MNRVLASCILFFWVTGIAADPSDREFRLHMMVGFGTYTRFFPYLNHQSEILRVTGRDGGATSTGWKKDASGVAFGLQFDFDRWRAELEPGGTGTEDRQMTASRVRNTASEQSELHYLHARDIGRSGEIITGGYRLRTSRNLEWQLRGMIY